MIIGKGNIASVLHDRDDLIYFASGVSNSAETSESEFEREIGLLLIQDFQKHLVYFSSLSVYRDGSLYNKHKLNMERIVKQYFKTYTIVRIEVIAWGKNPTTIHNVFRRKLQAKEPITIQDTFRYIVTKEEFLYWIGFIKPGISGEMNIPGTRYEVIEILKMVKEGIL